MIDLASVRQRLAELSTEKAKLLELLLERRASRSEEIRRYARDTSDGGAALAPASWAQQRLWFVDQLVPGNAVYNIPLAIEIPGPLEVTILRRALDELLRRHEVLRTSFVSMQGELKQEIWPAREFELSTADLSGLDSAERELQVRSLRTAHACQCFDLRTGPLIRGCLIRLRERQHLLLIAMHHIVSDGWSTQVMVRELARSYGAYEQEADPALTPLRVQYADYAQWQREWLSDERLDRQLSYWLARLEAAAPEIELPTDRPRPPVQSFRGGSVPILVDAQLTSELGVLARSQGMTLFMVLCAGWTMLLARLSGREDIVVGTPVANRRRPELEELIGFFVNTLVLRVQVDGELTLSDFLQQVRGVILEAYDHQDVPFEQLVEKLRPQRSLTRHPIFQVMLALQNAPSSAGRLQGWTVSVEEAANETAKFDLLLSLEVQGQEIRGVLNYATDLFEPQTIERWAASFTKLLKGMVGEKQLRIGDLSALADDEREQVVELFNGVRPTFPTAQLIHQWFEQQVQRTPNAPAVIYEAQSLTYAELNTKANQLAWHLRSKGVGPDQLVALCVERSLDLVVGLIAILKAGAAYLPLDPNYPMERLHYVLEDANPRVLLTQGHLKERLPPTAAEVLVLDVEWERIATNPIGNPVPGALSAQHLAYVIYTSGSTGKPKGVMVEHRNVTRLFAATEQWFGFDERDVWTVFHSFAFDFSVWELWGALLYGGRVVVVPYLTARSPDAFYRLTCEQGVTVLNQTPSAFAQFIDAQGNNLQLKHALRVVIFGGEALELRTLRPWIERNGADRPQLVNMYGITETTVHVTYRRLTELEINSECGSLIGKPIPDLQVYVLDKYCRPVPIGVVGEMYVGGAGVARGYLNRPELTAERFVADPFVDEPSARLYRSGDLARWRADGTLVYLGRNDHQVKIRGFRIELGEIEAQLARHEQVKDAIVLAREDIAGDKRLVAYVVHRDGVGEVAVDALREHLKGMLPEYMVPSAFVTLASLPLTANGKLDRQALPVPNLAAYVSRQYEAPQGEVEETVAAIWQSLLRVERVGRWDNFFELGGHSLLIVQMMERLSQAGLTTEVRRVFETPTLAALAHALTRHKAEPVEVPDNRIPGGCNRITPQMLPLVQLTDQHIERIARSIPGGCANIQDIYPLAPLQEGILFHHLLGERGGDIYVLPVALEVSSRQRLQELIGALQAVINRHDVLRTSVLWEGLSGPVQIVWRQATLPVEEVTLDRERDPLAQVAQWMLPERQRLDLQRAPLMRLQIAADPVSEQWYVLLQLHHIIDDATSLKMVISEALAHLEHRAQELPEPAPYRNHVAQSLAYARNHDAEAFFRSKLANIDEPTAPYGLLNVYGDGTLVREAHDELEPELAQRIRAQARRLGVSAATVFHAAWGLVLARTTGRDDVVFGSVLLGRLQGTAGAQRILGMFINTLPLRLQLQGIGTRKLIERTQHELVELLSHEQASLAVAQRCAGLIGSAPLFTTLLNYRHRQADAQSDWSNASGIRVLARQERTNYPITLSVDDLGGAFRLTALTDRDIDPHRITAYLRTAVESVVASLESGADTAALALPVLPEQERREVMERFNANSRSYTSERLIHELVEQQTELTPQAVAVQQGDRVLTYAQLNARANQLAHFLVGRGVEPGQVVAVCLERSTEMIVGLLGILKAGAGYMPLDPSYPLERLQDMLIDAAPRIVLTQRELAQLLPVTQAEALALDEHEAEITGRSTENLSQLGSRRMADDLVYVIYTSGSTGRPKGTAMPHHAMVNLIEWQRDALGDRERPRVLQFAALSFDVAFQEIFTTLATGGALVLLEEWVRRDARALLDLLCGQQVERLFIPPLMLQTLADYSRTETVMPASLRDVIVAGEQLRVTPEIVAFFERLPGCRLHNHYGPTETHVVTALTLSGAPHEWPMLPTIGRPIANTQIYILDRQLRPAPLAVPGEIYIGGANVAQGYLHRPELTAQRFTADPFNGDPAARLYRTGDLARWRADGTIEYLGRNDDQVKIRGFRIELGEVEARLGSYDAVREATVVARQDAVGDKRLVAYLTLRDHRRPSAEELRTWLKAQLPDHMIPGAFVILDSLPLTPSGKLNRRALPAPELGAYALGQYEPPQGPAEQPLADIWREVLGVERVGSQDNFFELGGHSLLVLKALLRINLSLRCALTVTDMYRNPTVRELAACIGGKAGVDDLVDLSRESALAADIIAVPGRPREPAQAVLLTGATGFFGRFLLAHLLESSDATIFCLVRARSTQQAAARLRDSLLKWDLWSHEHQERIVAIAGDLRAPGLGLDAATQQSLAERIDCIYHCATSMNHLETYAMAKAANVAAAHELLRFATSRRPKIVNYASTLGVFGSGGTRGARTVRETTAIDDEQHAASQGYVASKWVAEKIFMIAAERGIPCNIFRLGLVWADSQQGRYDELQREYRVMKSCLLSGYGIANYRHAMPPTPVDHAVRAVTVLASQHPQGKGVFHISAPAQLGGGLFESCNAFLQTRLELVSYYDWICRIKELHYAGRSLPVVPLIEFAFSMDRAAFDEYRRRLRSGDLRLDCSRTHEALARAGVAISGLDEELLKASIASMLTRDGELHEVAVEDGEQTLSRYSVLAVRAEGSAGMWGS